MRDRGQALVELALCLPILVALALGGVQLARLGAARAGLDAATAAAAAAAARARTQGEAQTAAGVAFAGVARTSGLEPPIEVSISTRAFSRGSLLTATGTARLRLGFSGLPALAPDWYLRSDATARVEDWRSRPPSAG